MRLAMGQLYARFDRFANRSARPSWLSSPSPARFGPASTAAELWTECGTICGRGGGSCTGRRGAVAKTWRVKAGGTERTCPKGKAPEQAIGSLVVRPVEQGCLDDRSQLRCEMVQCPGEVPVLDAKEHLLLGRRLRLGPVPGTVRRCAGAGVGGSAPRAGAREQCRVTGGPPLRGEQQR